MWHFGKDALTSYSGEKFDMSCEDSFNVFITYIQKSMEKRNEGKKRGSGISQQTTEIGINGQVKR